MKPLKFIVIKLSLIILSFTVFSQVKDIGIDFKKDGFIRIINSESRLAIIDFIVDKEISTELVSFSPNIQLNDLKAGMEVSLEGENFRNSKFTRINKVIFKRRYDNTLKIKNGRIDAIEDDYAVIEGHRVKLNKGTIIKGVNGYNKTFTDIHQLLLGDIVEVKGKYRFDGFLYADLFCVEPDIETKDDMKVKSGKLNSVHQEFYSLWQNKQTRKKKLGKKILGFTITNDEALQDYVNNLGMRLVPEYIKTKIKYMFIVVNDDEFNAGVFPNGLALVHTGLLKDIQNEAQLAAVLGHEIAHSIYEHGAKRKRDLSRAIENAKSMNKGKKIIGAFDKNTTGFQNSLSIDSELSNMVINDLPVSTLEKKLGNFSVAEESQADRVGLYLLTKAGYDPREASTVWKNVSQKFGNDEIQTKSYLDNVVDVAYKNEKTNSSDIIKSMVSTKIENNSLLSAKTHPYTLDRFKDLHEMTYYFWSSNELLNRSTKGFDRWYPFWQKLHKKR
jgi:beta-barrel assembly-enhancing protease